jgi:hypothetical protein
LKTDLMPKLFLLIFCVPLTAAGQQAGPAAMAPRQIPGINAKDSFPNACVDCHIKRPEMDVRFSTLLKQWGTEVDPQLLSKAKAAAPQGLSLKGKHPQVPAAVKDIPASCLQLCHAHDRKIAPPFARMIHRIHMVGGEKNHFLTLFQGECTHCHKLKMNTGQWIIPSAAEK